MPTNVRLFLCLLLTALNTLSIAQHAPTAIGGQVGTNLGDHLLIKEAEDALDGETEVTTIGSPYLNDEFTKGNVYSTRGSFEDVEMRYNIQQDVVEFRQNNATYYLDPSSEIIRVDIGDYSMVAEKNSGKMGYFVLIDSGKVTLMSKKNITYREARAPQALQASSTPARYTNMPDTFYYKVGSGPLVKVGSLKKLIAGFPGDHKEELRDFASREKISVRKQDELVRLIRYFNAL